MIESLETRFDTESSQLLTAYKYTFTLPFEIDNKAGIPKLVHEDFDDLLIEHFKSKVLELKNSLIQQTTMSKLNFGPIELKDTSKEHLWRNQVIMVGTSDKDFTNELIQESLTVIPTLFEKENFYVTPFPNFIFDGVSTYLSPKQTYTIDEIKQALEEGKDVVVYKPTSTEEGLKFHGKVI